MVSEAMFFGVRPINRSWIDGLVSGRDVCLRGHDAYCPTWWIRCLGKLIFLELAKTFSERSLSCSQQHPVLEEIMNQLNPVQNLTLFLRYFSINPPSKKKFDILVFEYSIVFTFSYLNVVIA